MLIAFELSGEHKTIPPSEVRACLESLEVDFALHLELDRCLIIDVPGNFEEIARILSRKLAMTHHIIKVMGIGGPRMDDILEMVEGSGIDFKGTYSIRARCLKGYSGIDTELVERQIGRSFYEKGFRANLENPEIQFRILLVEEKSIFGHIIGSVDRSAFEARKPHLKPFFYPGVL
ncbi:MAG TPA: THUMP domain-containing protein, partial [Candidatus Methanoperedens sp.]